MANVLTTKETEFEKKFSLPEAKIIREEAICSYNDQISVIFAKTQNFNDIYYKTLNFISEDELVRIREAYRAGCLLKLQAPPHAFSKSWVAIKAFKGKRLNQCPPELKNNINLEPLFHQLAKCYIMGYSDCGSDNLFVNDEGNFVHVDLARHFLSSKISQQIKKSIKHVFSNLEIKPSCFHIIKGMATNRAKKIRKNQNTNILPEIIRKNIKKLIKNN